VSCTHLDQITVRELPSNIPGCQECLKIGCCDNSPNKHATAHFHETSHPIIRSAEPGEDWSWCYVDEIAFEL
jgi:ubiquitin-hydrolase Zn-finger-containing protein